MCEKVVETLMGIDGKKKTQKTSLSMMDLGIKHNLHPVEVDGQIHAPDL